MLRAEADAARVFALCGAGRVDKARAAATRFVQRYPSSPAAARVQAACK
jgi:outer membrane protein assembly factor BamD (BamD/ComL family)